MRTIFYLVAFGLSLVVAIIFGQPPAPQPASIAQSAFSATRAMVDVEAIAPRAHALGSADIIRVRHYLRERLTSLGLDVAPDIERQPVYIPGWTSHMLVTARVRNVVATLKGTDLNLPAILLMSHYDTVPNSPGAADDTAGVAATLEIIANLKAVGPLKRDVIVLLTEGEERGLLGSRAFFDENSLAKHIGLVLNLETRGGGGRTFMFETSDKAGGLIAAYGDVVAAPAANSLTAFLYRHMPNGTDLTNAFAAGLPGMNFAFIGDELAYHTAYATPDHLDRGSLQHMGDQVLALTKRFANADTLEASQTDQIYADFFGLMLVRYSVLVGWLLIAVLVGLTGLALFRASKLGLATTRDVAKGAGFFLLLFLVEALVLTAIGFGLGGMSDVQAKYALLGRYDFFLGGFILVSFAIAILLLASSPLRRRLTLWGAWLGGLALLTVMALLLQLFAPRGSILIVWPLFPAVIGALAGLFLSQDAFKQPAASALAALFGLCAASMIALIGGALFLGVGGILPAILAVPALLVSVALFPGLDGLARHGRAWQIGSAVLLAGVLSLGWARFGPASEAHPRLTEVMFLAGPGPDDFTWISMLPALDEWSGKMLRADGGIPIQKDLLLDYPRTVWRARAAAAPVPRPIISGEAEPLNGATRITFRIKPGGTPREFRFLMKSNVAIDALTIDGKPASVSTTPGQWTQFLYAAPPSDGFTVSFNAAVEGSASLRVFEVSEGWPDGVIVPARPKGLTPFDMSDTTYAASTFNYNWRP